MKFYVGVCVLLATLAVVMTGKTGRRHAEPLCQRLADAVGQIWELVVEEDTEGKMCAQVFALGYFHNIHSGEDIESSACLIAENKADPEMLFRALDEAGYIDSAIRMFYDGFAAIAQSNIHRSFRDDATGQLHRKCYPFQPDQGITVVRPVDLATLVGALELLGTLDFDTEGTRLISDLAFTDSPSYFPDTCYISDVGDNNARCLLLKRAFTPVWNQILANPTAAAGIRVFLGMFQVYTGIDFHTDIQNAAPDFACRIGVLEDLIDVRQLLEDLDVKSTLLPLAIMNLNQGLSHLGTAGGNVIDHPEGHSERDIALARAQLELSNAWQEFN